MPFGEIFTGAFQRIWRHKKLWLLAMLGLGLTGVGSLIYGLFSARWLGDYFNVINRFMLGPDMMPERLFANMMRSLSWIWAGAACVGILGVVGYVVNLVARGAIISEARYAWRNEATDARRGLRRGAHRAAHLFLIDLLWWLPAFLLVFLGILAFVVLVVGSSAAADRRATGGLIASAWLAFFCCGGCLGLLYYLAYALFAPLMYQAAVAGERDLGSAVREGWALARANLGAMLIFWLLLLLVGFVLGALLQSLTGVVSLPLLGSWFGGLADAMQGLGRGELPVLPRMSGPLVALLAVVSAVVSFLVSSFTQTLNLTVYAGVYQHLAGGGLATPVSAAPVAPIAPAPPASPPVGPLVPPETPVQDELPPTL